MNKNLKMRAALICLIIMMFSSTALFAQSGGKKYVRLDAAQAAVLLVDHQTGLFALVQDFEPAEFKNNVLATAALAKFFNLPTVLSTSLEEGPNGPLLPEIREMHPDAPGHSPSRGNKRLG